MNLYRHCRGSVEDKNINDKISYRWCLDEGEDLQQKEKQNVRNDIERRDNEKKDGELDVLPTS